MYPGTIAGFSVCIHSTTMPDRLQRFNCTQHDLAPRFSIDGGDETHAACVMFLLGRVGMSGLELARIGDKAGDFDFGECAMRAFRHRITPLPLLFAASVQDRR